MGVFSTLTLKGRVIAAGFILAFGIIFAIGGLSPHTVAAAAALPVEEQTRAERVMRALAEGHPRRISGVEFRNGDWAVLVRDTWFYYAEGRILPQRLLYRIPRYRPLGFYNYPRNLQPWTPPTPEQIERFRGIGTARAAQLPRPVHFFDALYMTHSRNEAYRRQERIMFLGREVQVHQTIIPEIRLVERHIQDAARTDASVRAWIANIDRMYGWNWRNIGGTQSRSFHAYGVALDIMPRATGGRAVFWAWAGPEWWNIPHEGRYHPPDAVIRAFELHGFVWGGKWSIFDTIHWEFRPEIFVFSGLELVTVP
ncbi:MAG: M15 family metallopeptidase [Treponema sp.]|nr:M15 family metallopeptidase [Treponema sp.]